LASSAFAQSAPIEIQWWHAMTAVNGERVNKIAADFNASQKEYKVVPVYKGNYPETMSAGIAAFRGGNAPHIIQIFEVGTATMMAAKGAIKPVYQLMAEANEKFDPSAYLPTVAGYYSTADGKMLSLPFNSSSAISYYNKDAFARAGLDPEKPPRTWPEWFADAKKIRAAGYACGFTAGWITWTQIEQFNAWHNMPIGTQANGMAGLDTQFVFNTPFEVKHIAALAEAQKDKAFDYGGRYQDAESKFLSGDCGMLQSSSSFYGNVAKNAKFKFATFALPYYPEITGAPQNSIIGGASLWVMSGKNRVAGRVPQGDRLPADHQGGVPGAQGRGLLPEEPGYRGDAEGTHQQGADREFARPALRQSRADPRRLGRGPRGRLRRQGDRARSGRQRGEARQRPPAPVRGVGEVADVWATMLLPQSSFETRCSAPLLRTRKKKNLMLRSRRSRRLEA
jgi:maltose-binding protein MalE